VTFAVTVGDLVLQLAGGRGRRRGRGFPSCRFAETKRIRVEDRQVVPVDLVVAALEEFGGGHR